MPQFGTLSRFPSMAQQALTAAAWEVVASATSIAIKGGFIRVTGNTTISTITAQNPYIMGPVFVINTDASVGVTDTGGNIALATTLTRYKLFIFAYDPATSKWYPSAAS